MDMLPINIVHPEYTKVSDITKLLAAEHPYPHDCLGMHLYRTKDGPGVVIRVFLKNVLNCHVLCLQTQVTYKLNCLHSCGFFEGFIPCKLTVFPYKIVVETYQNQIEYREDPYSYLPSIDHQQLYYFHEGNAYRSYDLLGARMCQFGNSIGIAFTVWAPNAKHISVVGDFNQWDGRYHPMRTLGYSGVWELFIPDLNVGIRYKFELLNAKNQRVLKTDPYGLYYEGSPNHAAIAWDISDFQWSDAAWLSKRSQTNWQQVPISIYEINLDSWKWIVQKSSRPLNYRELASHLIKYVLDMGFTHVEFMPLTEYPFLDSWGYQVTGFFAPTHRYGTPQDFMYLIDQLHQHNIGVIMDWVGAHFPKDAFALANFDGTALYEHVDPKQAQHQDWGTLIFNYGRNEVKAFLAGSVLSWIERFHIDGFRMDAVASMIYLDYSRNEYEWIPNQYGGKENIEAIDFLKILNERIHRLYPGIITIAEESTAFAGVTKAVRDGGLGFDFKWNMGWMHDVLDYLKEDPIHRKFKHHNLTFGMLYQDSESFMMVFSHDEVVHQKQSMLNKIGSKDLNHRAHTLRALYTYMWFWPGKKTLFMGCEFGQFDEWNHRQSLDWHLLTYPLHSGIQQLVKDLNKIYLKHTFLSQYDVVEGGFEWIEPNDSQNSVLTFLRCSPDMCETFVIVLNFTPVVRSSYRVGVPHAGQWIEYLNTDASIYEGANEGNYGAKFADPIIWNGRPYSLELCLPGLSAVVFHHVNTSIRLKIDC